MPEDLPPTMHIAEGGFRPRPELLQAFGKRHEQFMPHAIAQAGFRETYGGPIAETPWWLFFAKFDTLEAMEAWQHDRVHVEIQDEARATWWTAYYLRKGRFLAENESASGNILNETTLLRDTPLSSEEHTRIVSVLSDTPTFGIIPYETLKGEQIGTPYLFAELAGVAPQQAPVHYVVLSSWRSTTDCQRWRESTGYQQVADLGTTQSSCFQIIPERKSRMGLQSDRMQREWTAEE